MNKIYQLSLFLVIFLNCFVANSAQVSESMAKTVAINFLKNVDSRVNSSSLEIVYTRENAFYIYGYASGWVIVSADDRVMPILGYSTEGVFITPQSAEDTIRGNNFWGQMKSYENQVKFVAENNIPATDDISSQWQSLTDDQGMRGTTTVVPPLLTTTWDQGWPYNELCPGDAGGPGGHVWTGCVATAMAQILKYHNYPSQGLGSYGYQWGSYPYTGADFGATTYNWSNMPNSISTSNLDIATIMYQTAVSCHSMWGAGSTGVSGSNDTDPMTRAFVNYFKTAFSEIKWIVKLYYTATEWENIIQTELVNNRPVYYRGDGSLSHAWVCDGVDAANMYHFNWGWGGMYNGYFALSNINPGGNNLTNNQCAIIGIKPNDGSTLVTNTTWAGTVNKTSNIAVPDAITLTTSPGAVIHFAQNCKLQIWGKLTSIGTSSNYVRFTAVDTTTGWLGIKWDNSHMDGTVMADNDSSKLIYTQVEYSDQHGIFCQYYGKILIDHCKINNNHANDGAGISVWYQAINISNTEIYNNHATNMGGGFFLYYDGILPALISQNNIHDNVSDINGGGILMTCNENVVVKNNNINNNQAIKGGGGEVWGLMGPTLVNNKFCNNSTVGDGKGGGLYIESCSPNVVNNLFTNNTRGGLYITTNSNPMLVNNTISNNSDPYYGGGIRIMYNSNPSLKNTILYGNTAPDGSQISLETTDCDPFFDHCDIQGGVGGFGGVGAGSNYTIANYTNNIELDPVYISPSGGAGSGYDGLNANWQLQSTSPCINAGDTTGVGNLLPVLDLGGNPRINGVIDMGVYEFCAPSQPDAIAGNPGPCEGSSQTYAVTNVAGVTYNWALPDTWTIYAGQGSNSITVTVGTSPGNISVTPGNSCGNGTARTLAVTVNALPAQPGAINGNANPCQGSSQVYSVNYISGISYTWTVPESWAINAGQGSNAVLVTAGTVSDIISVTPANSCGVGPARQLSVIVSSAPSAAAAIEGNTDVCQGENSVVYTLPAIANATSYAWTLPNGAYGASLTNSISVNFGSEALSGEITVKGVNDCGEGEEASLFIQVDPLPEAVTSINGAGVVCAGAANVEYSTPTLAHADSYNWTLPPGFFGESTTNSISIYFGDQALSGTITVNGVNDCGEGEAASLFVQVNPLPEEPPIPIGPDEVDLKIVTETVYKTQLVQNASNYFWELEPYTMGEIVSQGDSAVISWSGQLGTASLKVRGWNSNCEFGPWSEVKSIWVDFSFGINKTGIKGVVVFPNPSEGVFTVKSQVPIESLLLKDANGKTVLRPKLVDRYQIDVEANELAKGIYFLEITHRFGKEQVKLVLH